MADFTDRVRLHAKGGDGGAGVVGFERLKGRPKGRPTGGSGGHGGDVVIESNADVGTLHRYARRPHWTAEDGGHGQGDLRNGHRGSDLVLPVPLGTLVHDDEGTLLADLVAEGQRVVVAGGGRGGRGNAAFVNPSRKVPSFSEQGEYGEETWVTLNLKLLADAAIVGFPNAGKSTLISRISAAKPKIADYPFTTLTPNLGVVVSDDREFVIADIPGLVEGAADGKGLGHEFLRHAERSKVLLILLDPTSVQEEGMVRQYEILQSELSAHSPDLAVRPHVVAVNKIDAIPDVRDVLWWAEERGIEVYPVSAVTGAGIEELVHAVADEVGREGRTAPDRDGYVLHRPGDPGFTISRQGTVWLVQGRAALRAANLDDLTSLEAADFVARRLARLGVDAALVAAGAVPGDDVRIGDLVFTFEPERKDDDHQS